MTTSDFPANLNDKDLSALAFICGQVETYTQGGLPPHALRLSDAVQAEQRRRIVALRNPVTGTRRVELKAGAR